MNKFQTCPDIKPILAGLKDFQQDTVDYIFRRLYLDSDASDRFLVADEVGLGKTLIARGLIAKAINHLWDQVNRIDILYICSNADIARQNIQRLNITEKEDFCLASRITLLPLELRNLQQNRINFISFTPGTSFDLKSNLGTATERATLYWLLHKVWDFRNKTAPKNIFQGGSSKERFREQLKGFQYNIDKSLAQKFQQRLEQQIATEQQAGKLDLYSRFTALCDSFCQTRELNHIPWEEKKERNNFIGDLRLLLAKACISALEPNLIILDEFQRFKHLLEPKDDFNELAHELFNYSDELSPTKVVLLSATPYKMYTMHHESGEDNHYEDFLRTIQFLQGNDTQTVDFEELLTKYRYELLQLNKSSKSSYENLKEIKSKLEYELRRVMVRTERLSASPDRNGMLVEIPSRNTKLETQDLETYLNLQSIARILEHHDTLEYWKSAPYLLNFMDNYELKRLFTKALSNRQNQANLASVISTTPSLLLSHQEFSAYAKIDPCNARLRGLLADTVGVGCWKLLWIPPSLPYYQLSGVFADSTLSKFTKRLVFSSWRIVPKVIATLLSYEAERQMISRFEEFPQNTSEARKRRHPLLRFARTDGRLTGMQVLGLLYPSTVLARECNPLSFAKNAESTEQLPTKCELLKHIQQKIEILLQKLELKVSVTGNEDESWYWVAPILLDHYFDSKATQQWFSQPNLANSWAGEKNEDENAKEDQSSWCEHVKAAKDVIDELPRLGKPPSDLSLVLAQTAIASPGVTALRSLARIAGGLEMLTNKEIRISAAKIAWSFRSIFNSPEATALLRGIDQQQAHWRRVLNYCVDGCLQSVLDEYAHILRESLGLLNKTPEVMAVEISQNICKALTLRTSVISVDNILADTKREEITLNNYRIRAHFALRFGEEQSETEQGTNRAEQVREAFNSPFRPFVLATTSVGQEGLDFHPYCHAIVHWNLPSNPVDLEQREGRVHRYKGHAVRKNLALKYGLGEIANSDTDPWETLFAAGKRDRPPETSDLVPFWIYPLEEGAKIERHVPNLPLSRDCERLESLRRSLTVYRMVFGQSRQEDLLNYLLERLPQSEAEQVIQNLQINLEPNNRA
ncbi:DEAD/DEAH box helicase [Nostoc sp. FACHB-152]|uniref:helicase-related protein n=1 Tax=Nostoc sp. FACHB-152 TaxID=2692837 RepID=UPI0016852454|nr:helicase-related protein [Nostoc sp. FACHB-152]MBD2451421.1 DEAD/DEAH box helicase [Nostoc sp. FACHB-152]